jgi:2-haloacid dehalogenase
MRRYDGVLFDLLTALLDSWTLWNDVAGSAEQGLAWRQAYLKRTYETDSYRPYQDLVAEAAVAVGLDRRLAKRLDERYAELAPWPGARETLTTLAQAGLRLGVVTNCSRRLGHLAASRVGIRFDAVITAEEAGFYKPHPKPYEKGLAALGVGSRRCLFVAGSAYDLAGTSRVGLDTYWHDRIGMTPPEDGHRPLAHERTLEALPRLCGLG